MYSGSHLNTPPPPSQFRRPWSPDPYDPLPSNIASNPLRQQSYNHNPTYDYLHHPQMDSQQRREVSDVSVEALDLADYSRTLRARESDDPYAPFNSQPSFPLRALASRDSTQPTRVPTITSNATSFPSSSRNTSRRPFSLPPPSAHVNNTFAHRSRSPQLAQPQAQSVESEIDVSRFPVWSRNWYTPSNPVSGLNSPPDIYTPLPASHLPTNQSPFDPGYKHREGLADFPSPDGYYNAPASSFGHNSSRDLLPWSTDPLESTPIDSAVKEERMRILEREFGPQNKSKTLQDGLDENGNPIIGSVDENGRLVTQGPKKRMALRMLQIILTLTAGVPSIYAALIIKPKAAPPPSGKPPAFVLYILSVITLPLLFYLFIFQPCCCQGRRRKSSINDPLGGGMMVLPVQTMPGGKHGRKNGNKRGKKEANREQGNVHVNLIVDPHMFRKDEEEESEDGGWNESLPGTYDGGPRRKKQMTQRRSVFAGLAMEEDWKRARSYAKKLSVLDAVGLTLWGAAFVFILIGKRCPSGSFEGWCNAYNVSSAAACLLSVAFGVNTFFDVKDLHASKTSPRTGA